MAFETKVLGSASNPEDPFWNEPVEFCKPKILGRIGAFDKICSSDLFAPKVKEGVRGSRYEA